MVSKVQYHSVFCNLEEYGGKSGMIHISEVHPGRIRNIRDFVQEGKPVVCKVIRINEERGHIDLSLRRVSEGQRRQKANAIKQEQKAEKLIEIFAKQIKKTPKETYAAVQPLLNEYEYFHEAFEDVIENQASLTEAGLPKEIADPLEKLVKEKISPKEVSIQGTLEIRSFAPEGVSVVKEALKKALGPDMTITYLGAGKYRVSVVAKDYKKAEGVLQEHVKLALAYAQEHEGTGDFSRT